MWRQSEAELKQKASLGYMERYAMFMYLSLETLSILKLLLYIVIYKFNTITVKIPDGSFYRNLYISTV